MPAWLQTTVRLLLIVGLPLAWGLLVNALFSRLRRHRGGDACEEGPTGD